MHTKIAFAYDRLNVRPLIEIIRQIQGDDKLCDILHSIKVHVTLDNEGLEVLRLLQKAAPNIPLWVDAKLHDTPDTVRARVQALHKHGVRFVTVHASGGVDMLKAAVGNGVLIIAVTALTTLTDAQCLQIYGKNRNDLVTLFTGFAIKAGVHGIVSSAQELEVVRLTKRTQTLTTFVPGIVINSSNPTRGHAVVCTPGDAVRLGAQVLVIGREITESLRLLTTLRALYLRIEKAEGYYIR